MFTDNELRRIKAFKNEREKLMNQIANLQTRLWYQTHGTHNQTKANQIQHRRRLLANKSANLYKQELQYANALRRKYGLQSIYSLAQPNLKNVEKAMRMATRRGIVEKVMRPSSLSQNVIRTIARLTYPSPPRQRYNYFTRRYIPVEPW